MATKDLTAAAKPAAQLAIDNPPIDDAAIEALGHTILNSFTAQPSRITPFGGGSTLRWNVSVPSPIVTVLLNGVRVSPVGTQAVHPAVTTRYTLTARARGATKNLGGTTVQVDTSACISANVPESVIRSQLQAVIDRIDAASSRFKQRAPARVEIDAQGIHVALRLSVSIDNFADPDVDIDFTIGLRVRNGAVEASYTRFDVDVDWPWWVTVVTLGASKIVEEFLDDRIEKALKPQILAEVRKQLDTFVDQLPGDLVLHTVMAAQDRITVTACPAGPTLPFLVLAKAPQ